MSEQYENLRSVMERLNDVRNAIGLLSWDQEVMMPSGGAGRRAGQISTLSGLLHEKFVNEAGPLIKETFSSSGDLTDNERRNVNVLNEDLIRQEKLSTEYVMEFSRTVSEAQSAWEVAKRESRFAHFQPHLERVVKLCQVKAQLFGYEEHPYDALLDEYEPGGKTSNVRKLFDDLKPRLSSLLEEIRSRKPVYSDCLHFPFPVAQQLAFNQEICKSLGYSFEHGRLDQSSHPFSISFGPEDARITTRLDEGNLEESLYSSIHEAGHAMYEQGLSAHAYGLPAGEACSLSIHESQSRLWENNVARSFPFWNWAFGKLAPYLPSGHHLDAESAYRAANCVAPNLIRISSDELTYHFHIILRFELEQALIDGSLAVSDLPQAWNEKVRHYLGLEVPDDRRGVLQDIHWSHGSIGYFPTYSLGSMYAAQFMATAARQLPGLTEGFGSGNFAPLNAWLHTHVYAQGRQYRSDEICRMATGESLNPQYFMEYLRSKYLDVYR